MERATTLPDGQLLIPKDLFHLLNERIAELEKFFADNPETRLGGASYDVQTIRQLPLMLRSAQRQPNGDVLVSNATRLFLARCLHDFMTHRKESQSLMWLRQWINKLLRSIADRRNEPRELLALPLKLGNGLSAVTRNISASGMYVEIPGHHEWHGLLGFEMQLGDVKLTAEGRIVRLEHRANTTGIAIKLSRPQLELSAGP